MAILSSHTQGNLHIARCVCQCCPLILDSYPSIKYVPSVQTILTMECPKSHNPFVLQSSQLLTLTTFAVSLFMAGLLQLLVSGVHKIYQTNPYIILLSAVIVGASISKMFM